MNIEQKHPTRRWEVSIVKMHDNGNEFYKVTRRLAEMSVAETQVFPTKEEAKQQFEEWLTE